MLKGKVPLLIALALGLVAFAVSFLALRKAEADLTTGLNPVMVVTAKREIGSDEVLTEDMIETKGIPERVVTASVITPEHLSSVVGQRVIVPLQANDMLLWTHLESAAQTTVRLANSVRPKYRAITITAQQVTAVAGFVKPNDRVDLIGTFKDPKDGQPIALTLLENIIVLATGKITGNTNVNLIPEGQRDYANVTLLLTPEESEVVVLAQSLGQLTLALRNDEDTSILPNREVTKIDTLVTGERKKYQERRLAEQGVQIVKGSGRQ